MAKKQKRSSVIDAFDLGASGAKLGEHYKRSTDIWQQYSTEMFSLLSGSPDPARYMKRSLDLTMNLHRDLAESCFELVCGEDDDDDDQDVDTDCLAFQIDRWNESTAAKPFKLPLGVSLPSICKSSLKLQGGTAEIPAAHVHLTRRNATAKTKKLLYVSLVDLSDLVRADKPGNLPLGIYKGKLTISPGDIELLTIRVELIEKAC